MVMHLEHSPLHMLFGYKTSEKFLYTLPWSLGSRGRVSISFSRFSDDNYGIWIRTVAVSMLDNILIIRGIRSIMQVPTTHKSVETFNLKLVAVC